MIPNSFRILRNEYLAVAKVIRDDKYINMSEEQFLYSVMKESGGSLTPSRVRQIYYNLMKECG